jgi:5,10-methylenetetrahydromethanopterin reductase
VFPDTGTSQTLAGLAGGGAVSVGRMRIGIGGGGGTIDAAVESVRQAKEAGYASAWFSNIFGLDGMTACAVAGREVADITLGTFVVPTYSRHPLYMAQQAMTTQAATGGRFILGIGLSHQIVIEGILGLSFDKPARHMREYLEVLMPLLEQGTVEHAGELFRVNNTFGPIERMGTTPPRVVVAALGPVMLKLAGRLTDGTATWMTGPNTIADHIAPTIRAAAAEVGRPEPMVIAGVPVSVTDDPDAARVDADSVFAIYGTLPSYRAMLDREGAAGPGDVALVGDEVTVRHGIERYAAAGVTDLNVAPFGDLARTTALVRSLL